MANTTSTTLAASGLSPRAQKALTKLGAATLGDIATLNAKTLRTTYECGKSAFAEIKAVARGVSVSLIADPFSSLHK
jgi:hypothetical protein